MQGKQRSSWHNRPPSQTSLPTNNRVPWELFQKRCETRSQTSSRSMPQREYHYIWYQHDCSRICKNQFPSGHMCQNAHPILRCSYTGRYGSACEMDLASSSQKRTRPGCLETISSCTVLLWSPRSNFGCASSLIFLRRPTREYQVSTTPHIGSLHHT